MPDPEKTPPPPAPSDDDLLDEALDETFPASDPIAPARREKLPPADAPGSDVRDE
ncbi:MAG: hypothetical protein JF586_18680 [Burkholderiales bacterium]|jgi:hypothetical protein|nr:hypothetical protein [Burkholderiales bacterium]